MAKAKSTPKPKKPRKTKAKGASEEVRSHNQRDRAVVIREVFRKLDQLETERETLNAKASNIKNTYIKGELGMKVADLMAAYRLYRLEGADRADYIATLRETFTALKVGEQLGFLDVIETKDREIIAAMPPSISTDPATAFDQGYKAGMAGKSMADNPYDAKASKILFKNWDNGHHDGLMDRMSGPRAVETEPQEAAAD